ncbi:MAG: response regulator transcription factor [Chloroflexi bacterium]|nr:response regulator transcription factor [Chloroflexota bacterium]
MPDATALLVTPDRLPEPAAIVMGLARRDLAVVWARDLQEALQLLPREAPQVILVDLATSSGAMDPRHDAAQVCQRLRALTHAPMLVLGTPQDKPRLLRALSVGADAFLFKPIDPELLVASLAALRRRQTLEQGESDSVVRVRQLEVDRETCEVRLRGEPVALTPTEFRILSCLARNLGRVVSARQLLQEAQGYPCTEREAQQIVKVHIRHLRRKLVPAEGERPYITNVRSFGYLLERRATPNANGLANLAAEGESSEE